MPIQPGDVVTLSLHPALQLSQYQYAKTSVAITRKVGKRPKAEIRDMRQELKRLYYAALHDDLTLLGELSSVIRDGDIKKLAAYALARSKVDVQATRSSQSES